MENVLFIGNRHTYLNDMPLMLLERVNAEDRGFALNVAQSVFYMTWANKNRPENQAILAECYAKLARQLGAKLAPVGLAWERVYQMKPGFDLHHRDGRPANPAGSYLTACVFYSILLGLSPEGLPGSLVIKGKKRVELDDDHARFLQKTAFETVRDTT
jgi:hypothetical protein